MSFDMRPYGYTYVLKKENPFLEQVSLLSRIKKSSKQTLITEKTTYQLSNKLGIGSYGTTYKATADGKDVAIKKIKTRNREELWSSVKEVMLQVLLYDATKDLVDGPYVPELIEVAYDPSHATLYIVQELMDGTLKSLIEHRSKDENEMQLPIEIEQIAARLEWLGDHLQFNHRDLKPDNIMYKRTPKGVTFRLIDFGTSCLTWKGISLVAFTNIFSKKRRCNRSSRDITSLFVDLQRYEGSYLSAPTIHTLRKIVNDSAVNSIKWSNIYSYLNRSNVEHPYATPASIRKTIRSSKPIRHTTKKRCRRSPVFNENLQI